MKIKSFIILLIVVFFVLGNSAAQSIYSSGVIGELQWYSTMRAQGMGNTGVASVYGMEPSRVNPALWSRMTLSNVSGGFQVQGISAQMTNSSFTDDAALFSGLTAVIKIGKKNGFGFGFVPYSRMNYRLSIVEDNPSVDRTNIGKGGISQAFAGWSVTPSEVLSLGFSYNFYFGSIDEAWQVDYIDNEYDDTDEHLITSFFGTGISAGLLFNPGKSFRYGFSFLSGTKLTARDRIRETGRYETDLRTGKLDLPFTISTGISILPHKKWEITGDFTYRNMAEMKYNSAPVDYVDNEVTAGIGAEYIPNDDYNTSFFDRALYRFGFYTKNLYLKDIDGSTLRENFITIGMGIPYFRSFGMIDISLQLGVRGNKEKDLAQEKVARIGISFSGKEKWFIKRQ